MYFVSVVHSRSGLSMQNVSPRLLQVYSSQLLPLLLLLPLPQPPLLPMILRSLSMYPPATRIWISGPFA